MSEEKAPSLHDLIEAELTKLRAHPSSASLSTEHIVKLLELLAEASK